MPNMFHIFLVIFKPLHAYIQIDTHIYIMSSPVSIQNNHCVQLGQCLDKFRVKEVLEGVELHNSTNTAHSHIEERCFSNPLNVKTIKDEKFSILITFIINLNMYNINIQYNLPF